MKIIFSDFDGTLTNNGKLGAVFFDLLELIESRHSELVIVSGRSISWGHFLLTHFPLFIIQTSKNPISYNRIIGIATSV